MSRKKIPDRILDYMRTHEWISPIECFLELHNYKLATNISLLIRDGYKIEKDTVYYTRSDGTKSHYMRYHLVSEPERTEM